MTAAPLDAAALERPVEAAAFDRHMAALGPFERRPALAVGVSGGPDSLALVLLADRWARARDGSVTGLIVDHRLRPESGTEAATVAGWLADRGIASVVLRWAEAAPGPDLAARARAARHGLLQDWCAGAGVLHLLLAHQADDQAETLLLRLGRGSGVDGLSAMAPVEHRRDVRLVRPLLGVPKAALVATCRALGQGFVEDPSNRDPAQARARLRAALPALGADGLTVRRLAATAAGLRRARIALEDAAAALLVRAASPHPGGFCRLDRAALAAAPREVALRALAAVLGLVGGGTGLRPRLASLERLLDLLAAPGAAPARTLAGCRITLAGARAWVAREPAAMAPPVPVEPGRPARWDRRFVLYAPATGLPPGTTLGGLGAADLARLRSRLPALRRSGLPGAGLPGLPALRDLDGLLAVPHLSYCRQGLRTDTIERLSILPDPAAALIVVSDTGGPSRENVADDDGPRSPGPGQQGVRVSRKGQPP